MDHATIAGLMQAIAPVVRQFLGEQLSPIMLRLQALEARLAVAPEMGPCGKDGMSLLDALTDAEGYLCLTRSDGALLRPGRVVGRDGLPGRGIEKAEVAGGHLRLVYSDDTIHDAGEVVGPPGPQGDSIKGDPGDPGRDGMDGAVGRSIEKAEVVANRLMLFYSDGAAQDAGDVRGLRGDQGPPGDSIKGDPGQDGVGIEDIIVAGDTRRLKLTNGAELDLGQVVGRDGTDGVGIEDIQKSNDGHAIALLTDGRRIDLGRVEANDGERGPIGERGLAGLPGDIGPPGVGIVRFFTEGLTGIVEYSDGRKESIGRVVGLDGADGAPGRGVSKAERRGDRLVIRYTDGAEDDAGEVVGSAGPPGPPGEAVRGDPGRDGVDGRDADPEFVRALVTEAVATIPAPKDGRDGADADPEFVRALVTEAVAAIPIPKDGEPGPPGESIKGDPGRDGIDGKDADPELIRNLVTEAVAEIPRPRDGTDGKDADPELVRSLVAEAVAAIPPPRDGRDGTDGKDVDPEFIQQLTAEAMASVHAKVAEAIATIPVPKDGEQGPAGRDGKDADPEFVRALVVDAVAEIPKPRDGVDGRDADPEVVRSMVAKAVAEIPPAPSGKDGKDADPEFIKGLVTEAVATIPPPKDGRDGEQGPEGRPGRDGSDADATKAVAELHDRINALREWTQGEITDAVTRAMASADATIHSALATVPRSHMVNADGDLVCVHRDGTTEIIGHVRGENGRNGDTPAGVDHFELDPDGNLIAFMTDGRSIVVGRVRGIDGTNGRDGKDGDPGPGIDDMEAEFDGRRTLTLRWTKDDRVIAKSFQIAIPEYQGIWKADAEYLRGDFVTYAGGLWCCRQPNKNKPGDGADNGWQLAVKAPRNGRSVYDIWRSLGNTGTEREFIASLRGPEGKQGPVGPSGRDRT